MQLIETIDVTTTTTSVTFSNIPQTFTHLKLYWGIASSSSGENDVKITSTNVSGLWYYTQDFPVRSAENSSRASNTPDLSLKSGVHNDTAFDEMSVGYMWVLDYTDSTRYKKFLYNSARNEPGSTGGAFVAGSGHALVFTDIDNLTFEIDFQSIYQGSKLSLYGIE